MTIAPPSRVGAKILQQQQKEQKKNQGPTQPQKKKKQHKKKKNRNNPKKPGPQKTKGGDPNKEKNPAFSGGRGRITKVQTL